MYTFEEIIGNKQIIKRLRAVINNNNIFHAYIIDGKKGMGKKLIAKTFAKALQCENEYKSVRPCGKCLSCKTIDSDNHTDVIYVRSTNAKSIGVSDIREQIVTTVDIKPYKYKYKIYIVENAETMTVQAQNALLKTIEEPPSYVIFLLLSNNFDDFLSTVLSRCIIFKLKPLSIELVKNYLKANLSVPDEKAMISGYFSQGSIGRAIEVCGDEQFEKMRRQVYEIIVNMEGYDLIEIFDKALILESYKDNINEALDLMHLFYRDMLTVKKFLTEDYIIQRDIINEIIALSHKLSLKKIIKNMENIFEAKKQLRQNANFQLTMEHLLFKLKEK